MQPDAAAVLITGTSSGIGRATALHLDHLGFRVFAGVRKEEDARLLKETGSRRLTPLILDVTDESTIRASREQVEQSTGGALGALINNAGISLNGPLELMSEKDMRRVFDVNVLGLMSVTRNFIPFLRREKGRIINVSSGHGKLAIPDKSVYSASKFAVEAVSASLRTELRPFGITVSNLVVGKVDSAVLGKILEEREAMVGAADPAVVELYAPLLDFFEREVKNLPSVPPIEVAKVVAEALNARKPKVDYLVGPGARKMKNLSRLPVRLRDILMYKAIYGERPS